MFGQTLFAAIVLIVALLFLGPMTKRVEKNVATLLVRTGKTELLFKALTGKNPPESISKIRIRLEKVRKLRRLQWYIMVLGVVTSLMIFLHWLLVLRSDEVIPLIPLPIIAALALMLAARSLVASITYLMARRGLKVIDELETECAEMVNQTGHLKDYSGCVLIDAGDHAKAPTKKLEKVPALFVLFPTDNILESADEKASIMPFMAGLLSEAGREAHEMMLNAIKSWREWWYAFKKDGRTLAVIVKPTEIKRASLVLVFVDGDLWFRAIIRPVVRGKEYSIDVYKDVGSIVRDVLFALSQMLGNSIYVIFLPLRGTVGWSTALNAIDVLGQKPMMVILIYESNRDLKGNLCHDIKDAREKMELTRNVLSRLLTRIPSIYLLENTPSDNFDRQVFVNINKILAGCCRYSSGTSDTIKLVSRGNLSPFQSLIYHSVLEEGIERDDLERIRQLGLADVALAEAVFGGSGECPSHIERRIIDASLLAQGFIMSYGLYGVRDEFLADLASSTLEKIAELNGITSERILEELKARGIQLRDDEGVSKDMAMRVITELIENEFIKNPVMVEKARVIARVLRGEIESKAVKRTATELEESLVKKILRESLLKLA